MGSNKLVIHYAADTNADTIPDAVTLSIVGDAYDRWASAKGLSGGDAGYASDPDSDGIRNGLEFVLGGEPNPANPGANSVALLPAISESSGNLIFTFKRKDLSKPSHDQLALSGSGTLGGTLALAWNLLSPAAPGSEIVLIDNNLSDTFSGFFSNAADLSLWNDSLFFPRRDSGSRL